VTVQDMKIHAHRGAVVGVSRAILSDFASVVCIYNAGGYRAALVCFVIFGFLELSTMTFVRKLVVDAAADVHKAETEVKNEVESVA
jgi:hypothetical protein